MKFFEFKPYDNRPIIEVTGRLYNEGVFGVPHAPPDPGKGFGRVCSGGSKWHDCLDTTMFAEGVYVFSQRVGEGILAEGLTGLELYELEFERSENKRLRLDSAPKYYWGLFTGKAPATLYNYNGEPYPFDEVKGHYVTNDNFTKTLIIDVEKWDGSDFFELSTVEMGYRFVSDRVVEAARKHQWTNFAFRDLRDGYIFDLNGFTPTFKDLSAAKQEIVIESDDTVEKLLHPKFELIERHFNHSVPAGLRQLYADEEEVLRENFLITIIRGDQRGEIPVGGYTPIDEDTLDLIVGFEQFIVLATDGMECLYLIDPTQDDPEVHSYDLETSELDALDVPLSEFISAPRRADDES